MKTAINLLVPMRDNVSLRCDLYRPDDDRPLPAILMRTPYGKEKASQEKVFDCFEAFAEAGYNVVIQDVRGTGESEGILKSSGESEYADGYDTVEWVASQPWCDGNVGMFGLSYFGFTQHAAASMAPPHLKAICPFQNSAILPFSGSKMRALGGLHLYWLYSQALNRLEKNGWSEARVRSVRAALEKNLERMPELLFHLPLRETPAAKVDGAPLLQDYVELVDGLENDDFWRKIHHPTDFSKMDVAMFHLSGWYDMACDGTIGNYLEAMSVCKESVRRAQKLVIGPWAHGGSLSSVIDGFDFGHENSGEEQKIQQAMLAWFDYYLKGTDNGIMDLPAVRYYVMGTNSWRETNTWPPEECVITPYYLQSDGHANSLNGSGRLTRALPGEQPADRFIYDPGNPFPSDWKDPAGHVAMADQRTVEARDDVLVYTTETLEQDIEVTGNVKARLFASSSAVDTDFTCRLLDVSPDGSAHAILNGLVRAKFRQGPPPQLIEPYKVYEYEVDLGHTSKLFAAGHRIRVEISSSLYPQYDRNLNTGEPLGRGRKIIKAWQTILHHSGKASAILLPIRPADPS